MKRLLAYIISLAIAVCALAAGDYLGYVVMDIPATFSAFVVAFGTATALHGLIDL